MQDSPSPEIQDCVKQSDSFVLGPVKLMDICSDFSVLSKVPSLTHSKVFVLSFYQYGDVISFL